MNAGPKRQKLRPRYVLLAAACLLPVLAIGGACWNRAASRVDAAASPHPGRLYPAGTFRLNLYCTGQGRSTVVLESGLADSLGSWARVQPAIAHFARVCSYDRAGYGTSDPGPMPRTAERIATELHTALESAGEKPPFLLVGHSFGGFCVRLFNGKYPGQVSGIVLVDSTQEDQYRLLPVGWRELGTAIRRRARRQALWAPLYVDLGIARLEFLLRGEHVPWLLLQTKYLKARTSELENIEVSAEQARAAGHVADKPLIVLTAGRVIDVSLKRGLSDADQRAFSATWVDDLQMRLVGLSLKGKRVLVSDSGHDIPSDRPDVIVAAVRELIVP